MSFKECIHKNFNKVNPVINEICNHWFYFENGNDCKYKMYRIGHTIPGHVLKGEELPP